MARDLRQQGHAVGRNRIRRLMRLMGFSAVAPEPSDEPTQSAAKDLSVSASRPQDRSGQFTSETWTDTLLQNDIEISMDGTDRWMDTVFIERLWRSCKYECVYLHAFEDLRQAQGKIGDWIDYYNHERPHSTFGDLTPDEVYRGLTDLRMTA